MSIMSKRVSQIFYSVPLDPVSVQVCQAVKTSSNYLLMVFIPRSHPRLHQNSGLLLVDFSDKGLWLAETLPSPSEYNLSLSVAKEYTSTLQNINKHSQFCYDPPIRGQWRKSRDLSWPMRGRYTSVIFTSPSSGLAASPCLPAAGRSWPVSSAASLVCWTAKESRISLAFYGIFSCSNLNLTSVVSFFIFFLDHSHGLSFLFPGTAAIPPRP